MIKGLLFLIVLAFAVSFGWGWVSHVKQGSMDMQGYVEYYEREVTDNFSKFMEYVQKTINFAEKPLPARKEAEFPR